MRTTAKARTALEAWINERLLPGETFEKAVKRLAVEIRRQEGHRIAAGSLKNVANGSREPGFDLAHVLARFTALPLEQIRQPPKPKRRRAPAAPMGLAAAAGGAA